MTALTALTISPEDFMHLHDQATRTMRADMATKNAGYATQREGYVNALQNFGKVERDGLMSTEEGLLCRASDKHARLVSYVHGSGTEPDKVVSDCFEAANYWIALGIVVMLRRQKNNPA